MTVLAANVSRPYRLPSSGITLRALQLAGYTNFHTGSLTHTVYKGSVVVCDVSDTDGYFRACPLSSSVNLAAGDIFGGIAMERVDVTADNTADGSKKVSVAVDGIWAFPIGSLAITDLGAPIYASDDNTVTTTSTNNIWIGTLVDVDATYAWVDIAHAAGKLNSAT